MKIVSDLSVTAARPAGQAVPWDTPWLSPITAAAPGLVLDFAAQAYGAAGAPQGLSTLMSFARSSTASHFDAVGNLVTVANDVPRLQHDPATLATRGLLLEQGRTNLIAQSANPASQTITVPSTPHVLSFYGSGTVTASGAHVGSFAGTGAFPARSSFVFTPSAGDLTLSFAGDVTHAQLEEASQPSSVIDTQAVAGARADDVATVPLGAWFNQAAGTLVFSGTVLDANANDRIIEIDAGDATTRVSVLWNTTLGKPQLQAWSGGALQAAIAPGDNAVPFGTPFRVCIAYAQDDFAISLNGSPVVLDTLGSVPSGLTTLRLGRSVWGAQGMIEVESVVYYGARLPDSEISAMSA